jgi:5-methylcytosine-specific restriction endonuclease McrA
MQASSQKGPRVRRPWTPKDQAIAEVAAACGISLAEIGRTINRDAVTVRHHVKQCSAVGHLEACRRYREANRQKHRDTCRRYREAFPDRVKESVRRFHAANPGARRAYYRANHAKRIAAMRAYYRRNKERIREWRIANADRRKEWLRLWHEANPGWSRNYYQQNKGRIKEYRRKRYSLNKAAELNKTKRYNARKRAGRKAALVPVSFDHVKARFAIFKDQCAYCGSSGKMEADHVLALSRGGLDEPSNIIPACRSCNGSKHAQPVESWYRRQPFFTEARWRKIQRHCPAVVTGQLPLSFSLTP